MNHLPRTFLLGLSLLIATINSVFAEDGAGSCEPRVGQWLDPASGEVVAPQTLFEDLAGARVVLLGEAHNNRAHHRWQHQMLSVLHSRNANMIIGLEMLPRRVQSALDAWSAGELDESEFLEQSEWRDLWGYDAELYLPLLHFARLNRVPTLALNIDRELVSKVGRQGWQAVDEEQRMGLSNPALASEAYLISLARIYSYKQVLLRGHASEEDLAEFDPDASIDEVLQLEEFTHFVDAQLTWDRAMAEAIASALADDEKAMLVGIIGRGHLEHGWGVPRQLADLGIGEVEVLLPVDADDDCDALPADLARAVFVVDVEPELADTPGPLLGVMIEASEQGVRVMDVVAGSVAADAGIETGDLIQTAAGFEVRSTSELIDVIQRQAPGTWLPLKVLRGDQLQELVARFPRKFE